MIDAKTNRIGWGYLLLGRWMLGLVPAYGFENRHLVGGQFLVADKELSALLARDLLIPIVHDTTYEALREISPLLGSRSGLSTAEETMAKIAAKLAELVTIEHFPAIEPVT